MFDADHDHHAHDACREVDLLAGTPYRVIGQIGAGGMGTVLEAEHQALGRRVVVKLLLPELARNQGLVDRLKREARVLARVASPYIVAVTDLGQTVDGSTYLVMERLHGRTLRGELQARGVLPIAEAIQWTKQVLLGLASAHRAGIVHRDVKLDNIFLCDATEQEPRRIKLLDFGIAKVQGGTGLDSAGHQPTAAGTLLGSPRWLAPEQARGEPVDARADLYSVGLVLYSLLVGHGPFAHLDPIEALAAAASEQRPQPPSRHAPQSIPPALDDAVMMALEKAPERRFQSAEAFIIALDTIAATLGDTTHPLPADLVSASPIAHDTRPAGLDDEGASAAPAIPLAAVGAPRRGIGVFLGATVAGAVFLLALIVMVMRALGRW